jgi:RNA polymerase sigma-70 factor (ECF subfamily)
MKAFLYHILNNLIIDQYRKNKTASLDTLLDKGFEPSDDESSRFLKILDGKSAVKKIDGLPEMYKKILGMRFIQNLTIKEISQTTGQTKNAIAVQVHRGLEKLKVICGYAY